MMVSQAKRAGVVFFLLLMAFCGSSSAYKRELPHRIYWEDAGAINNLHRTFPRMDIATRCGYNGVMIDYMQFGSLEKHKPEFFDRYKQLDAKAKASGITIIPGHFAAWDAAKDDYMLAEAAPVRGTPFRVANGTARCASDHSVGLLNGGFESFTSNKPANWSLGAIRPGTNCFQDKINKHSGASSFKVSSIPAWASMNQRLKVKPHRAYRITAWFKTQNLAYISGIQFKVYGSSTLLFRRFNPFGTRRSPWNFKPNMNWTQCTADFNSMNNTTIKLEFCFGNPGYGGGDQASASIWIDDLKVEEVGLYETMRRRNCPIYVKSSDGRTSYKEGTDYVVDPKCNNFTETSFFYEGHLKIPAGSRIQSGQTVKVDWYKFSDVNFYHGEGNFCLPETWRALDDNVRRMDTLTGHKKCMMVMFDEWRGAFMDDRCQLFPWAKNAGDYMAGALGMSAATCRKYNSARTIIAESDMYDPYHNSRSPYHMCVRGAAGSWKCMDTTILIMNWNAHQMEKSIGFFMGLDPLRKGISNPQLLYAQGANEANQKMNMVEKLEKQSGKKAKIAGMMWKTWGNRWEHLELTAKAFQARGWWGKGEFPSPKGNSCEGPACDEIPIWAPGTGTKCNVGSIRSSKKAIGSQKARFRIVSGTGRCEIQYHLPVQSHVEVRLTDVRGRTIRQLVGKKQKAGTHRISMETKTVPTGVYFISLRMDGKLVKRTKHVVR